VERTILERAGYTVTPAADVEEALRAGESGTFDILVTDVMLPGGTGPGLFRQLAALKPALRVLYVSGYSPESVLDQRQLARPARILTKPFTEEALAQNVREVLDR
jgi:CheY-like chemotaxis protein